MSAQPWQVSGSTVYQLTDAGDENLWWANVNGLRLPNGAAHMVAVKMAAAEDMYEALNNAPNTIDYVDTDEFANACVEWFDGMRSAALAKALPK